MTDQRHRAVLEVQAGVPLIEVAERIGGSLLGLKSDLHDRPRHLTR